MEESGKKAKRAMSIRLDPDALSRYADLMEGAGLTVSDGVRVLVERALKARDKACMDKLKVNCEFRWHEPGSKPHFPENVGVMRVTVTPPDGMTEDCLHRLVFVIPEFFEGKAEPFRIDSFHYHRVCNDRIAIASTRVSRHILSFRLHLGVWRAAMFSYSGTPGEIDREYVEMKIRNAVTRHIESTIACYLIDHLPDLRLLTQDEVKFLDNGSLPTSPSSDW